MVGMVVAVVVVVVVVAGRGCDNGRGSGVCIF